MKKKFNLRMKVIASVAIGIICFLAFLPSGAYVATGAAIISTGLPFIEMPKTWSHLIIHRLETTFTRSIEPLTEEQVLTKIKEKMAEGTVELKAKIKDLEEKSAKFDELKTKLTELETKSKDLKDIAEFKTLAQECSDLAVEVKSMKEKAIEKKSLHHTQVIEKALDLQKDGIKGVLEGKSRNIKLDFKSAGAISTSNFGAGVIRGLRLPEIDPLDRNEQTILPEIMIIPGGPGSDPFSWVEKVVGEGGAAGVNESAAKPLYDWDYVENKVTAEVTAAVVLVTKQALLRMPQLNAHINEELLAELRETLQTQIITGNGAAPNLNGIKKNATAFNPPIQQQTTDANDFDVLAALATQVVLAHGKPGVVGVNPAKFYSLMTQKDKNSNYLMPPFMSGMPNVVTQGQSLIIAGMRVIPMWDLGADEFLGGDLKRYMFNIVEDINIEVGYFDQVWLKNQLAVRAEIFGNGGVKAQHKNKIVKGTFTYAKAILDGAVSS